MITAVSILLLAVCTAAGCGQKRASEAFIYGEGGAPAYAQAGQKTVSNSDAADKVLEDCAENLDCLYGKTYNGYVTATVGTTYLYALAGLLLGILAGNRAFKHIPNRIFSYIVYAYIGISGFIILLTA